MVRDSYIKAAAAYSPTWWGSTIGASGLDFSVRNVFTEEILGLLVQVGFDVTAFTPPAYLRRSLQRPYDVSSRRRLRA